MTSQLRCPRATSQPCAARSCCCSRNMRPALSRCGFSFVSASQSWQSRCRHGRMFCPPLYQLLGTTSQATPASWISSVSFQKKSRKDEKSPSLYVDRYLATRLCLYLYLATFRFWWIGLGSVSNWVMTGRRTLPEDIGTAGGQC